jgi:diacylglycerol kinase family enzyme
MSAGRRRLRVALLVNPRSGDGGVGEVIAAARARGFVVHVLAPGDDPATVARAVEADALAVAGGDGSLAPVAAVASERGVPFACVPLGTRNHFARDLGLARDDPLAALAALEHGVERRIDLARANDRPFLNNASLGLYARLVHRRERHRHRSDAFARLRALAILATHREPLGLTLDGAPLQAAVVLVANNGYAVDALSVGRRERLDEGVLHLYVPTSVLRGGWAERCAAGFAVDAAGGAVAAAVDGEAVTLETPIAFRIEPRSLRVLVPPVSERASGRGS